MKKSEKIKILTYLPVFEDRLTKLKHKIERELDKEKKHRSKTFLKSLLNDAKGLRSTIRQIQKEKDLQNEKNEYELYLKLKKKFEKNEHNN